MFKNHYTHTTPPRAQAARRRVCLSAILLVLASAPAAFASGSDTYVGIGVSVHQSKEGFQVTDLNTTGPAISAGVKLGDWITAVDAKPTKELKLDQVVNLILGEVGTPVTLTLEDEKTRTPHDVKIVRAVVTIACVLQGNISLNFFGDERSGTLSGWIGQDSVHLNVFSGRVSGYIDNEYINLRLENRAGFGYEVAGFIRGSYVTWRSTGTSFYGYQECIQ